MNCGKIKEKNHAPLWMGISAKLVWIIPKILSKSTWNRCSIMLYDEIND